MPNSYDEAVWIDDKNGNSSWQDAEKVELDQLHEYETFKDLGNGAAVTVGSKRYLVTCATISIGNQEETMPWLGSIDRSVGLDLSLSLFSLSGFEPTSELEKACS